LTGIPTPALLLDESALEQNIARMATFLASGSCRLRPHVKAHKSADIARRQLAGGACVGLTCATVYEAEQVAPFCDDLLIANELIGPGKCERTAALALVLRQRAGDDGRITVAVDSPEGIVAIGAAARAVDTNVGVLVDVNVGQNRCGVEPGEAVLALARLIGATPGLALRGLMGYEGHVQPIRMREDRERGTSCRPAEPVHSMSAAASRASRRFRPVRTC
jgi:D-serine deaminase-like pyridoxal phosphate-dependent protein